MALLERMNSMKQQGMSETDIINTLSEEGNSPLEINEALSQMKIKAAVAENPPQAYPGYEPSGTMGMQPSAVSAEESLSAGMKSPAVSEPQNTMAPAPQPMAAPQAYDQYQYAQQQAYAPQQGYDQQAYAQGYNQTAYAQSYPQPGYDQQAYAPQQGYYTQAIDIETVRDISKQQVDEALKKIREELLGFAKMKSELKFEMQDMENRLVKIESMMSEIQASIIRKIGEYGEDISAISKEIKATQQSFSKVINPLIDKKRGVYSQQEAEEEPVEEEKPKSIKAPKKPEKKTPSARVSGDESSGSFEEYFR